MNSIVADDVSAEFARACQSAGALSLDIETSGLSWRKDRIGTCQAFVVGHPVFVVRSNGVPPVLSGLIADLHVRKVFHHAMFDLRFLAHQWGVVPANIACTKIAAKLLHRADGVPTRLESLLRHHLGINIEKDLQTSDWLVPELTENQMRYAENDVIHLPALLARLEVELKGCGLCELAADCFAHIPARVQLDLLGVEDVYAY